MENLFKKHLDLRLKQIEELLSGSEFNGVLVDAGTPPYYYLDDQPMPFKTNPQFNFLCPAQGEKHMLLIEPNKKPELLFYAPNDFWHDTSVFTEDFWTNEFSINIISDDQKLWSYFKPSSSKNITFLSQQKGKALAAGFTEPSQLFLSGFNWLRGEKTDYEIHCIREANKIASLGHLKAKEAFLAGASETDINYEYLIATQQNSNNLPYQNIIHSMKKPPYYIIMAVEK